MADFFSSLVTKPLFILSMQIAYVLSGRLLTSSETAQTISRQMGQVRE